MTYDRQAQQHCQSFRSASLRCTAIITGRVSLQKRLPARASGDSLRTAAAGVHASLPFDHPAAWRKHKNLGLLCKCRAQPQSCAANKDASRTTAPLSPGAPSKPPFDRDGRFGGRECPGTGLLTALLSRRAAPGAMISIHTVHGAPGWKPYDTNVISSPLRSKSAIVASVPAPGTNICSSCVFSGYCGCTCVVSCCTAISDTLARRQGLVPHAVIT